MAKLFAGMLSAMVAALPCSFAVAQAPASAPAAEDPMLAASRLAFDGLPEAERKAIQDALTWVVNYNATSGGTFGRQTYNGINAYQKAAGVPVNGILDGPQLARLKTEAEAKRKAAGFKLVRDARSGVEIGVPLTLLPKESANPQGGSRWQSNDGKITLDTRVQAGGAEDLQALYERNIQTSAARKVTYKFQKPDFFVVTGETATGEFYVRYALGSEGIRGFTVAYDKSVKAEFSRMIIATANSFTPFPAAASAAETGFGTPTPVQTRRIDGSGRPVQEAAAESAPAPVVVDTARVSTGVRVGPRQVVTVGLACKNPTAAGAAAKILKQNGDLSVLEVAQNKTVAVLPLRAGPLQDGANLVVVAWDASVRAVGVASGSGGGETGDLTAALQAGGRGGLIFDRSGAVVGIAGNSRAPLRVISGVATAAQYAVIKAKAIQDLVGSNAGFAGEADQGTARNAGSIAAEASARIVEVSCP